ncbi:MAG: hypothetical protein UY41_C0003G0003 [Candidatus Moranbacteria bacterium GW2011_GWE1_49_15]|nr:MAG: hypothetical protein UX75_C0010G0026 [Candidatus Moranbacteria bacterium GW2011_GWE2_47_10]KKW07430.1 MAG: hypothetical protein UY41_C0003G0003 [Candidatus Moranbacteria bacterium GW2011_GWE1_49_15]
MNGSENEPIKSDIKRILLEITAHVTCLERKIPEEIILFSNTVAKKLRGFTCKDLRVAFREAETEVMGILSQKARHRTDSKRYMEDVSVALEMAKRIISELAVAQRHPVKKVA